MNKRDTWINKAVVIQATQPGRYTVIIKNNAGWSIAGCSFPDEATAKPYALTAKEILRKAMDFADNNPITENVEKDERLAKLFHDTYERLAPVYNYNTRKASAVPWEDVPENNKSLMVAVAGEIRATLNDPLLGPHYALRATL